LSSFGGTESAPYQLPDMIEFRDAAGIPRNRRERPAHARWDEMNIGELTDAGAVQQAMHEFDGGRDAFLSEHHFAADQYYVQFNSRLYDGKAIAGVAYGRQFYDRGTLPHGGFSGGEAGARAGSS
jgi:hypothetical protein